MRRMDARQGLSQPHVQTWLAKGSHARTKSPTGGLKKSRLVPVVLLEPIPPAAIPHPGRVTPGESAEEGFLHLSEHGLQSRYVAAADLGRHPARKPDLPERRPHRRPIDVAGRDVDESLAFSVRIGTSV